MRTRESVMTDDKKMWEDHASKINLDSVLHQYKCPADFQVDLKNFIEKTSRNNFNTRPLNIIEAGSETGVTSLLLAEDIFTKTLLDYSPTVMVLNGKVKDHLKKKYDLCLGDMFSMNFNNEHFDIVFNAGVLEHYNFEQRVAALREFSRVLVPNGRIIIAIPNHYSMPYRFAYIVRNLLNKWYYPKEFKIYDLSKEAKIAHLEQEDRITLTREATFRWVSFIKGLRTIFKALDILFHFEGYLTVIVLKKAHCA